AGRYLESPVSLYRVSIMARHTSRPMKSPRARGPMGWLAPSCMALSMSATEATPVSTRPMASFIMGIRILLTTKPGASATST
ncbi:Helix-turn-helix conjugative transposon-like domain-containing protein, partial [Dysosmobacter welbionis]